MTATNTLTYQQVESMLDNLLDETHETIVIGSCRFDPSQVLKNTDPIAYREAVLEYADSLREDGYQVED